MFNEEKTTQLALYILSKNKGIMPYLKLIKIMYLCDREMIDKHNRPITGDKYVAMKLGPVLSYTLQLIRATDFEEFNDKDRNQKDYLTEWPNSITTEGYNVKITDSSLLTDNSFDADEKECINTVIGKFISKTPWELVDYTHEYCPEWKHPNPYRVMDISALDIAIALNKSEEDFVKLLENV